MKQITAKFNTYTDRVKNPSIMSEDVGRILSRFILLSFGALAIFYVLILGNMVRNIIERRGLEVSIRALGSEVGELELSYLSLSNSVDLQLSYSMGFKDIKPTFATRKTVGLRSIDNIKVAQNGI